jgi:hypothetical protein
MTRIVGGAGELESFVMPPQRPIPSVNFLSNAFPLSWATFLGAQLH